VGPGDLVGDPVTVERVDAGRLGVEPGRDPREPDQGVTEAILAGYGLLDKEAPAFVALPALPVTKENLLEAWQTVYRAEAPTNVSGSMN